MESPLLSGTNKTSFRDLRDSPYWNIFLLAIAWSLTLTTSTLLTTIGPLSAVYLGATDTLAAFTIGVFLIGAAVSSVPSGWLFRSYGRYLGFTAGCICQIIGSGLGLVAMATGSLFSLYISCLFIGLGQGLGQFYRFSAVEITPKALKARAVTYVLTGGVLAAFLGPTSASYSVDLFAARQYSGSFLIIAAVGVLNQITISMVRFPDPNQTPAPSQQSVVDLKNLAQPPRSTGEVMRQPLFIVSCAVATLAHTIMIMIMSNVSVAMENNGYSFEATALVMELHFFAMFSPGFFSGSMIGQYGAFAVALVGGFIFIASSAVLITGTSEWNYILGMILVGVAWNLSFSAGTVMLTKSYRPEEATNVQAINDFILFSVAGAGSLLSGLLYSDEGWVVLILTVSALMGLYLLLFTVVYCYSIQLVEVKEEEDFVVVSPMIPSNARESSILRRSSTAEVVLDRSVSTSSASEGRTRFGKSFSEWVQDYERHVSFSSISHNTDSRRSDMPQNEEEQELILVRSISVT